MGNETKIKDIKLGKFQDASYSGGVFVSILGEGVTGVKNVMSKTVFWAFEGLFMKGTSRHGV